MVITDEMVRHMVNRFLGWRLPKPWNPDNGISYARPNYAHPPADHDWPVGTNLFDATQAEAMVRYMLEGMPLSSQAPKPASAGGEPVGFLTWQAKVDLELEPTGITRMIRSHEDETYCVPVYLEPQASAGGGRIGYVGLSPNGGAAFAREGEPRPDQYRPWIPVYTAPQPIAAEADTAKDEPFDEGEAMREADGMDGCPLCSGTGMVLEEVADTFNHSAADRLAPIEARGAVTDAMLQAARNAWVAVEVPEGIDDGGEESFTVHLRHAILAALRARESAPVQQVGTVELLAAAVTAISHLRYAVLRRANERDALELSGSVSEQLLAEIKRLGR